MMQLVMHKMESYTANKQTNNNAMALLTLTVGVNHGSVYSRISPNLGKGGGKESETLGAAWVKLLISLIPITRLNYALNL